MSDTISVKKVQETLKEVEAKVDSKLPAPLKKPYPFWLGGESPTALSFVLSA